MRDVHKRKRKKSKHIGAWAALAVVATLFLESGTAYAACKCYYCDAAVASRIRSMEASLIAQLRSNAQDFNTGANAIVETITQTKKNATESLINTLWEIYRRRAENEILQKRLATYEPVTEKTSKALCGSAPNSVASITEKAASSAGAKPPRYRSTTQSSDFLPSTVIDADKVEASTLFSPQASKEEREEVLRRIVAFYEPLDLNEDVKKNTNGGQLFELTAAERQLKLDAQAEVLRYATARFDRQDKPESLDEALEKAVVENGYPSTEWRAALASATETDVLRSAVLMASLRNVILAQRYEMKLREAAAKATAAAYSLESAFKPRLNAMRAAAYANAP